MAVGLWHHGQILRRVLGKTLAIVPHSSAAPRTRGGLVMGLLIGIAIVFVRPSPGVAASLTTPRDYLNHQHAMIAAGIEHEVFFTTTTAVSGGPGTNEVILTFPDGDDGLWCRTVGTLLLTGMANPTGATESATPLPGTLTGTCTQGLGASSYDTFTILGIDNLAAGTKYGVRIAGDTAALGTAAAGSGIRVGIRTNNGTSDVDTGIIFMALVGNDLVSISATVSSATTPPANPSVTFQGLASPGADITVTQSGTTVGTTTASASATFSVTLSDQTEGQASYRISAVDTDGLALAPLSIALNLTAGTDTVISGIFLGPSITVQPASVTAGSPVTLSGSTAPGATVTIHLGPVVSSSDVTSDSTGHWTFVIATQTLGEGSHSASAQATLGTQESAASATVTFSVGVVVAGPCDGKRLADFNCDGSVNLTDFSILLFFWQSPNPSNPRVNINHDARVDLVDFSIMLFQWTG